MLIRLSSLAFYAIAAGMVGAALVVVTSRNVFRSAIALTGALSLVGALFLLMGADFLGAAQILVYVGGIMIIMLFVVMFSQQPLDRLQRQTNEQWLPALFLALVVGISLVRCFRRYFPAEPALRDMAPTSASIGRLLLGDMVLPFEAVSLVLLAALVGAVLFGQPGGESKEQGPR